MAEEEARDSSLTPTVKRDETVKKGAQEIESQIQSAMRSHVPYFREQADSLTFEGVRRLLEKDLELETYALDKHKRYIRQCLSECLEGANDENVSKDLGDTIEKNGHSSKEEEAESQEKLQAETNAKEPSSGDEKMEDSPVMGLLTGQKTNGPASGEAQGTGKKEVPSESTIKKAIWNRATYLRTNSHEITMAGVRRLLEEDLKLDKNTLDPFKKFIIAQLDEVLTSPKAPESATDVKKKQNSQSKRSKKISTDESSDSLDSESEEVEDKVKSKKKVAPKGKVRKPEELKRKRPSMESKTSSKKQSKLSEVMPEENSDAEDRDNSEDEESHSSDEKPAKKKEVSLQKKDLAAPTYGKRVEHLKSIIRACAMTVPPSVYKRAKQAPENKRETTLIKELQEILSKEGLSMNPSEKEIKEVKRRKERAKELEGIDMSNIVSNSRRRSTTSFLPPPKPKVPVESEGDDDEDTDDDDDDNSDDGDDDNDGEGSQSEELNEDDEEASD